MLPPERQAEFHLEHTLATDTNDLEVLLPLLRLMAERLGRRLRRSGFTAARLRVEATYADHTSAARAVPLRAAVLDLELWDAARRAFTLANAKRLAVRAVALTLDRLEEANTQLELWEGDEEENEAIRKPAPVSSRAERGILPGNGSSAAEQIPRSARDDSGRSPSHHDRTTRLQSAIDRIRTRYGTRALATARLPAPPSAGPS